MNDFQSPVQRESWGGEVTRSSRQVMGILPKVGEENRSTQNRGKESLIELTATVAICAAVRAWARKKISVPSDAISTGVRHLL